MLYGQYPYQSQKFSAELMKLAIASDQPRPPYLAAKGLAEPSQQARNFVEMLLMRDPLQRPSSTACLALPAVKNAAAMRSPSFRTGVSFGAAVQLAKQKTAEFEAPVDPTVVKSMDELIKHLQRQGKRSGSSFSLPTAGEKSWALSSCGGEVSRHDKSWALSSHAGELSRHFSHGGELSLAVQPFDSDSPRLSECSTAATPTSISL